MRSTAWLASVVVFSASRALAAEVPAVDERGKLRTRAETVSFDAKEKSLELSGDVQLDAPPFHLRSDRIRLTRTKLGVEVDGKGRLAFCPCLGTPLTVDFDKAFVAPPGELILRHPTLRLYGVPVAWLPWFWLRSDDRPGLLPPDVAYRGQDGMFVGEGVHVPWKSAGGKNALDLRGGVYPFRGFAAEARLRTRSSTTMVRLDRVRGDDGLFVDARGATANGEVGTSWDADMLRGRRGLKATTDLDAVAKPFDRASGEAAVRAGPLTIASGVRAVTRRGGPVTHVDAVGPVTTVRTSGAFGGHVTYDATVEGGALRVSGAGPITPDTFSFARAELGAKAAGNLGPVSASLGLRGAGDAVAEAERDGSDRAGVARARLGVPLARAYRTAGDEGDPLVHLVEPFAAAGLMHARGDNLLGTAPGRAVSVIDGSGATTTAGISSTLGRWARRQSLDVMVAGGAAYGSRATESGVQPMLRGRASASLRWVGTTLDAADVEGGELRGRVAVGRARLGPTSGLRLLGNVAVREGVDPVLARTLMDAPLEPSAGFLARAGTTGGAGLVVPWSRWFTTFAGADADLSSEELVGARGGFELRDRCGCVTLRANGSHRIGRGGVDVWLALDFAADR